MQAFCNCHKTTVLDNNNSSSHFYNIYNLHSTEYNLSRFWQPNYALVLKYYSWESQWLKTLTWKKTKKTHWLVQDLWHMTENAQNFDPNLGLWI